ncbi:MAG: FlgD immunoglobulin-like domain containing protein [Candidatus Latescibacterota bacterium]|jgi:hypothetical protein
MKRFTGRFHRILVVVVALGAILAPAGQAPAQPTPALTDSLYNTHHPRLLFTSGEIAGLYAKVRDGGNDDNAYAAIRDGAVTVYPAYSIEELLDDDFALNTLPNLGIAGFLESPPDTGALALGRYITLYITDKYDVDFDIFGSALRLRSLALGYDMFLGSSSVEEREFIRDEIVSYIDVMTGNFNYQVWGLRPYLGNKTMMLAASLGLAAICLDGETDPSRVTEALGFADDLIDEWLEHQLDRDGAYNEGLVYASWSMRMLIYYFHARKRFDGTTFSNDSRIRKMENWFAYELLPEGSGRTNNLNDCAYRDFILSRHHTYFDWAQAEWGSGLSSWIWDHTAGANGHDWGLEADKAATVLWNRSLAPVQPGGVLPRSKLWEERGLYYYRSGWNTQPGSKDVSFSFYAGAFQGAHAQEDQGQFTLYGYGAGFAIDHGPGPVAKQTEAHNIILIDDHGQHNAGSSIGTDGSIPEYVLSPFGDLLVGDLAEAYSTHSVWNDPDVPFPGADWSWGYDGGNPVNYATRSVIAVHDSYLPPYFILIDDIEKDGSPHTYEWRMHTDDTNTVDIASNPIEIRNGPAWMDIHVLSPSFASLQKSVEPFVDDHDDRDASVLSLSVDAESPHYAFLMLMGDESTAVPSVSEEEFYWGHTVTLRWTYGITDHFICNHVGQPVYYPGAEAIVTDARVTLVRSWMGRLLRYMLSDGTTFKFDNFEWVTVDDGPLTCAMSANKIDIDRYNADFRFYAPNVDEVYCRDQLVPVVVNGDYISRDPAAGTVGERGPAGKIRATAYPNPFNPSTSVRLDLERRADVRAAVYDVSGRFVREIYSGALPAGATVLEWDGTDGTGDRVASGVYFLRVHSGQFSRTLKLVVVK